MTVGHLNGDFGLEGYPTAAFSERDVIIAFRFLDFRKGEVEKDPAFLRIPRPGFQITSEAEAVSKNQALGHRLFSKRTNPPGHRLAFSLRAVSSARVSFSGSAAFFSK